MISPGRAVPPPVFLAFLTGLDVGYPPSDSFTIEQQVTPILTVTGRVYLRANPPSGEFDMQEEVFSNASQTSPAPQPVEAIIRAEKVE
jgi:hypothetical protein